MGYENNNYKMQCDYMGYANKNWYEGYDYNHYTPGYCKMECSQMCWNADVLQWSQNGAQIADKNIQTRMYYYNALHLTITIHYNYLNEIHSQKAYGRMMYSDDN